MDREKKKELYSYANNANLVLQADRSLIGKKREEPTGEAESLAGKLHKFGDRVAFTKPTQKKEKYKPTTLKSSASYDLLLTIVSQHLGDVPTPVLHSATTEILGILQSDVQDIQKFENVKEIVQIDHDEFVKMLQVSKKVDDFDQDVVNVVFDDESDEEDGGVEDIDSSDDEVLQKDNQLVVEEEEDVMNPVTTTKKSKLKPDEIDKFWLQRLVSFTFKDPILATTKTKELLQALETITDVRELENEVMQVFDYDHFETVKKIVENRQVIYWMTKLKSSDDEDVVKEEMKNLGLDWMLSGGEAPNVEMDVDVAPSQPSVSKESAQEFGEPKETINLQALAFEQGAHTQTNKKVKLPPGSVKKSKPGYDEIHVPAPTQPPMSQTEKMVEIKAMPSWTHACFKNTTKLNRIQSRVYQKTFQGDDNLLICAPTGAGKTNCAMLSILRCIGHHRTTEKIHLDDFKIVYIAPMKALVSEMVQNFSSRLSGFGITVAELTGDKQLTKAQIKNTQVIVTTPEKWDIITRKASDTSYTKLVKLVIVDEVHLLHDSRGPVLESIISRMTRSNDGVRLVGLSATLPNYKDVATFMHVPDSNVFFFDNSFRPCPLKQTFVGITEKKAIKRLTMMNEICYEKIIEELQKSPDNQILVFVHSRKETVKTAKAIRDLAIQRDSIGTILRSDTASREILASEAENFQNEDVQELIRYGFAVHHAGMTRHDRQLVENLYADRHIPILVSTATLAWGVNLPAHTVIIKGTQVYSPELGRWSELTPQDMLQMLGRAGRPQYDTHGEGIIITSHSEVQYYLSLLNEQLPIESQLISRLPDLLNAEIVMGNVKNRNDGVKWLGYTYLYIRMLRNGGVYGCTFEDAEHDPYLLQKRIDFVHAAANVLDKSNLIRYDRKTGQFQSTELGRIASYYYISNQSMSTYNTYLKPGMSTIDLFRVFATSEEFKLIPVRAEEKVELQKLMERVPIPIKETVDDPTAKVNCLLQAYISQLRLEGFALMSDMVYVTQSAGRILRAIFELCLKRGWAQLSRKALDMCKMVDKRMWLSMSPLRQFPTFPAEVIKKLERIDIPWDRYFDLDAQYLGEMCKSPKSGPVIYKYVHQFPRLEMEPFVQPITRSMLKVELDITPQFEYDQSIHGGAETFWVLVEDVDSEMILYHDTFILKPKYANDTHTMSFTVPLYDPLPPNYFISLVSDRWLHVETRIPVLLKNLILPEKYPPHTELLDLEPLPTTVVKIPYAFDYFNSIQTQTFQALYNSDENSLVCAGVGSGKTICAEFALMRLWSRSPKARCVYMCAFEQTIETKLSNWKAKFGEYLGGKEIVALTGETAADLKLLELGDVIFTTPEQWDSLSRRWKQRKQVQNVELFIADDIHLLGGEVGPTLEVVVSRMRYISVQTGSPIRILGIGASLANARDLGEWIGCPPSHIFNFHPSARPVPIEIHIQGYSISHFASLMLAMTKPAYTAITTMARQEPAIVFVPNRKQSRITALEFLTFCVGDNAPTQFLHCSEEDLDTFLEHIEDQALTTVLKSGIAFFHEGLSKNDKRIVKTLYEKGAIQVLVVSRDCVWGLDLQARLVIVMGSQYYEGKEHRYVDYPVPDVLQMMGRASRQMPGEVGKCVLMCNSNKKEFYKKFLYEALPVESHLNHYLHDHFNAEIVTKTIENKQDAVDYLTWTFMYRRMALNPNFYDLQGTTHRHLSDHLSQLVEQTLEDLQENKCIVIEEDDVSPLNLGMIAAFYYINYRTIQIFEMSLKPKTRLQVLLDIISGAFEFETVPIRHNEDTILSKIHSQLPRQHPEPNYNDPHFKTNLLLQAHFSRFQLPPDLESDQKWILSKVTRLCQACVDVISSNGWLGPALAAMELSQMCVQAMWDKDPNLKQIPHFTPEIISRLEEKGVEHVAELMEMDSKDRNECLHLAKEEMRDVIRFVNRFPNIEVEYTLENSQVLQGDSCSMQVHLERETEDEVVGPVIAPYFPSKKEEGWWLVVGESKTKTLLAIKRITLQQRQSINLEFAVPETVGVQTLKLYFMCDSYLGVDQEFDFKVEVLENDQMRE